MCSSDLWSLWLGDGCGWPKIQKERIALDALAPERLGKLADAPCFGGTMGYCREGLPWEVLREMEESCAESTQYCIVVVK